MPLVSEYFGIGKTQGELDFVNVPVDADIPLFVDPFAISQRVDHLSRSCHGTLIEPRRGRTKTRARFCKGISLNSLKKEA
jgi:hypothetical protein